MSETSFPKKMIVASDGSKHSLHAAEKAAQMAKSSKSDVVIVHVLHPYIHLTTAPGLVDIGATYEIDNEEKIKKSGEEVMAKTKKVFDKASVKVSTRFLKGNVAQAIIGEAVKDKSDLIVVGATGRSGLAEWLLGSDAEKIARNAPCPVLIVR
ncbi:universal stress protein [Candidatus Bathyarchaeota archaeon]|nr:universal stress protein [Candidatus Bathyarchaeota archaeon]MCK4703769.1 universal stress protein [Candidatus Bathyarchaeota archaeon]